MNVAGRKIVGSTATPPSAGFMLLERLLDAARHRQRVGAELLLDDQHQAGAAVDDGVADGRAEILRRPSRRRRRAARRRCARRRRSTRGRCTDPTAAAWVMASRWFGVSRNPPACERDAVAGRLDDLVDGQRRARAADRDRRAPAAADRAGPRSRRWRRRGSPSAADGSSTSRACSAPPGTASPTSCRSSSRG